MMHGAMSLKKIKTNLLQILILISS